MMEGGTSAAEAPKAPSRKAMWAIIAVIVAIAVAASGTVWYLASAPQYAKFSLVALDFAYDQTANPDIHPLHHAKAGSPSGSSSRTKGPTITSSSSTRTRPGSWR